MKTGQTLRDAIRSQPFYKLAHHYHHRMIFCEKCGKKRLHHRDQHLDYHDWMICGVCKSVHVETPEERKALTLKRRPTRRDTGR